MKFHLALIIILILLASGCAKTDPSCATPSIPLENGCCLDINRNGVCDRAESDIVAEGTIEATDIIAPAAERDSPAEEVPEEAAVTATPVIGTGGRETRDISGWESITINRGYPITRCGKVIQLVSAVSSIDAGDAITLQIGTPRDTIARDDVRFVIESSGLDYVVQDFEIFSGSDEGKSFVSLKLHCK